MVSRKRNPLEKNDAEPILLQKRQLVPIVKKYKLEEETTKYCSAFGKDTPR